jgi:hypothetical protein
LLLSYRAGRDADRSARDAACTDGPTARASVIMAAVRVSACALAESIPGVFTAISMTAAWMAGHATELAPLSAVTHRDVRPGLR